MAAWEHNEARERRVEETRLEWVFAAALALFVAALVGLGSFLRFLW